MHYLCYIIILNKLDRIEPAHVRVIFFYYQLKDTIIDNENVLVLLSFVLTH